MESASSSCDEASEVSSQISSTSLNTIEGSRSPDAVDSKGFALNFSDDEDGETTDEANYGTYDKDGKGKKSSDVEANYSDDFVSEGELTVLSDDGGDKMGDRMNRTPYDTNGRKKRNSDNETQYSDDFCSESTDTSSETDVLSETVPSSVPSLSGCSLVKKADLKRNTIGSSKSSKCKGLALTYPRLKDASSKKDVQQSSRKNYSRAESTWSDSQDSEETSLRSLRSTLRNLDYGPTISPYATGKQPSQRKKNMSFNKEKTKAIDIENSILLRKIRTTRRKPISTAPSYMCASRVTSSAINRKRQQEKIDYENEILARKLDKVKATVNSFPKK